MVTETIVESDDITTRQLLDRSELIELINRYGRTIDRRDWDVLDDVFVEDAEADYTRVIANTRSDASTILADGQLHGRAAIVAWLQAARSNNESLLHFMSNHVIDELGDDHARMTNYVHERQGAYGTYEIEAVRTPAGWRIARLTLDLVPRPSKMTQT